MKKKPPCGLEISAPNLQPVSCPACGFVIGKGGYQILTDPDSQAALTGAFASMQAGLLTRIDWKATNGWVTLDLTTVTLLARGVAMFVQSCFTREKTLAALIDAAVDATALEPIDITAGWPS